VPSNPPLNAPIGETTSDRVLQTITDNAEITPEGRRVPTLAFLVAHLGMTERTIIASLQQLVTDQVLRQATNRRYYFR